MDRKGNAEAGFDLFALDQPAELESGVLGKAKVSREFVTSSELSVRRKPDERKPPMHGFLRRAIARNPV